MHEYQKRTVLYRQYRHVIVRKQNHGYLNKENKTHVYKEDCLLLLTNIMLVSVIFYE
jgi:hypothetical protein